MAASVVRWNTAAFEITKMETLKIKGSRFDIGQFSLYSVQKTLTHDWYQGGKRNNKRIWIGMTYTLHGTGSMTPIL